MCDERAPDRAERLGWRRNLRVKKASPKLTPSSPTFRKVKVQLSRTAQTIQILSFEHAYAIVLQWRGECDSFGVEVAHAVICCTI
mmetsp:Transcript_12871/g.34672  ORF Transcript_12871/g.34672 Transcript_12871/m.34672 type:complete len:85 (+) Transcript_12871:102-356(+)